MNFEYRQLERDGFCRMCHRTIYRGTEKVFTRYHYSLKQPLILCTSCVKEMSDAV